MIYVGDSVLLSVCPVEELEAFRGKYNSNHSLHTVRVMSVDYSTMTLEYQSVEKDKVNGTWDMAYVKKQPKFNNGDLKVSSDGSLWKIKEGFSISNGREYSYCCVNQKGGMHDFEEHELHSVQTYFTGKTVEVVQGGYANIHAVDWVEEHFPKPWSYLYDYKNYPTKGMIANVVTTAEHFGDMCAYIQDTKTERCYLINVYGIKTHEEN